MTNEEAEQRGFAASEDMDADMTPTPQAEEPGARQADEYASKHWSGDDYTAAFDSYIAGYQAALRAALTPTVAPDDEALNVHRFSFDGRAIEVDGEYEFVKASEVRRRLADLRGTIALQEKIHKAQMAARRDKTIAECAADILLQASDLDKDTPGGHGTYHYIEHTLLPSIHALKDKDPTNG